jgi:hypothetical protein
LFRWIIGAVHAMVEGCFCQLLRRRHFFGGGYPPRALSCWGHRIHDSLHYRNQYVFWRNEKLSSAKKQKNLSSLSISWPKKGIVCKSRASSVERRASSATIDRGVLVCNNIPCQRVVIVASDGDDAESSF